MKLLPTSRKIQTKQTYSFDEVFEMLKSEAKLPAEPYVYKVLGLKAIYIPGTETQDVSISVFKDKLKVEEVAKPKATNIAVSLMSGGWSDIIGRNVSGIGDIVNSVADEVQRIFGK